MNKQGKKTLPRQILKRKRNPKMLKNLALAIVITLLAAVLYSSVASHTQDAKNKEKLQQTYIQLLQTEKTLSQTKSTDAAAQAAKQKQIDQLNQQLQETQKQLQSKAAAAKVYAASVSYALPTDQAKAYIYSHESGNNPAAVNSIGCRGLGQACPGSKLPCGNDYACQDAWFTNYAMTRYGSWQAAAAFWQQNHWW